MTKCVRLANGQPQGLSFTTYAHSDIGFECWLLDIETSPDGNTFSDSPLLGQDLRLEIDHPHESPYGGKEVPGHHRDHLTHNKTDESMLRFCVEP